MTGDGGRARGSLDQVVLVSGHMIDEPARPTPRFPPSAELAVTRAVRARFRKWELGPDSLVITGGARGADIIGAEQALLLGADVWLFVALPDEEFLARSVRLPDTDWGERYRALRQRCRTRFQAEMLGPPAKDEDVFERNNEWCLDEGHHLAPPGMLRALVVSVGTESDGPGGAADFARRAHRLEATVAVINPLEADRTT